MKNIKYFTIAVCTITMFSILNAAELNITIDNIKNDSGTIRIALWNQADGFLSDDKSLDRVMVTAAKGTQTVKFGNLSPGVYAISLFHDENANEELDTNLVGIPKEGVGFTNNAMGSFGPPSFEEASIQIGDANINTKISMSY